MKYHKDGIARDFAKMRVEGAKVWRELADERARFLRDKDGHAYVELFVASNRVSAWSMGHIDAFVWPACGLSLGVNAFFVCRFLL